LKQGLFGIVAAAGKTCGAVWVCLDLLVLLYQPACRLAGIKE